MKKTILLGLLTVSAWAASGGEKTIINGAGATFPYPLYQKWFLEYNQKVDAGTEINYQSIGSGGGIKQLIDKTVDFGASDAPMNAEEMGKAPAAVVHIPTVLGAVVVTYNLPGVSQPLKLTPDAVADLFMGRISQWNDPKLAALNPGVALPKTPVMVVYRSDGSGTTAVFTEYLAKVSSTWKVDVGAGKSVKWKVGLGGKGNEGVTGVVKQTPGALGYVELTYAESNKLPSALIRNQAGNFVAATPDSVSAAAEGAMKGMPKDFRVSITDSPGKRAYPISAFTYLLVYESMDVKKGEAFQRFLSWAMEDGQKAAPSMGYAPLPKPLVAQVKSRIRSLRSR